MKAFIYLVVGVVCFCNCSGLGVGVSLGNNGNIAANTPGLSSRADSNANEAAYTNNTPEPDVDSRKQIGSFRVDSYEDNKLVARKFFHLGRLKKVVSYNVETNSEEFSAEFFYTKNGEFERLKVTKGDDSVKETFTQSAKDLRVQNQILASKGIEFPLPEIAAQEVSDISSIHSIAENYNDFKTDTRIDGTRKVITYTDFNKKLGFERGTMTFRSGALPILVKNYELTLNNSFPIKESLKTDDGELTKTYSYNNGKLTAIVYQFTDLENRTRSLEKRFEYHELNQKR